MRDENCIFCKIVAGEIPSKTIYEDELFKVIMDVSPATKGHCLVLPKNHYATLFELGEEETKALLPVAKKVATKMKDALNCDGFNLVQNNGEVANQTVPHFHLHLIPRYVGDGNEEKISWNHAELSSEEMDEIFAKLK